MASLLRDIATAFNNVYSGWILWNLFLALLPLALSLWLFRPRAVSGGLMGVGWGRLGLLGGVGLWPRLPRVRVGLEAALQEMARGDLAIVLGLLWLVVGVTITAGLGLMGERRRSHHPWLWWLALVAFVALLPNAPYVLTDIIHLIRGTSSGRIPIWVVTLVFIPLHLSAIAIGFEAYVLALLNLDVYLKRSGLRLLITPVELTMHALCAVGIYLGRFLRFNSWDLVTDPSTVITSTLNSLTTKRPLAVMGVTFLILAVLYWLMKQITLGLALRVQYARAGKDVLQ